MASRRIISIILQNEAGALTRVASLFSTRGYNIDSLSVAPTDDEHLSRLTLVTAGSDEVIDQISKQLSKLVDVVNIADMTRGEHIERELLLLKVRVNEGSTEDMQRLVDRADVRVLDDAPENFTVELTSAASRIDEFISNVEDVAEILAVVRSGAMAMSRGDSILSPSI